MTNPLSRKGSIWTAAFIAVVIIGGAYYFSGHSLPNTSLANAASTQELLKEYAAKDTDGDGMPDWEEALYCTDANNAHSVRADLSDAQAVAQGLKTPCYAGQGTVATSTAAHGDIAAQIPTAAPGANSLTDQFAKLFFNNYMSTRGTTKPSAAEMQTFVQGAITSLTQTRVRTDAYTASQVRVSGQGAEATRGYAIAGAKIFEQKSSHLPYDEIVYFTDALQKNDSHAIENLKKISASYSEAAQALVKTSVPTEVAQPHLALANSLARLASTVDDLSSVQTDPIRGMMGLRSYEEDSNRFISAMQMISTIFASENILLSAGDPGYSFYRATQEAAVKAKSDTP